MGAQNKKQAKVKIRSLNYRDLGGGQMNSQNGEMELKYE